ncbi:hypothetical protein BCM02_110162 [Paenibacillus methanolicus]|uniref:Uncharacterized protein n=1 Tax=Paenibacillus methanolicus TaxID=582686 RepID=A0A5S5BYD9_9BACL|nr:hypothetical protein BCM02_110162 [Paenibacillus methanolicus]
MQPSFIRFGQGETAIVVICGEARFVPETLRTKYKHETYTFLYVKERSEPRPRTLLFFILAMRYLLGLPAPLPQHDDDERPCGDERDAA